MKLMKKTLVTLAVTLGISGALSPAVNAATKTTNASISVLNIITMADRVYFQYFVHVFHLIDSTTKIHLFS